MAGILTAVGEAKVALSIGGTAITFAVLRIGDGNGAPIVPNRLMTDLVRRVGVAYPVTASARDPENPTHWRVTTEIPAGEGPFTCREIAVFDAVGDMIAIASHPTVEFTGPGGDQLSIITDIVFPVSGAANIAVTISPSVLMPISRNLRPFWLAVESASVTAPPANPAVGASYVVPADATGAWTGQAGAIVQFTGEDWATVNVPIGHLVCVIDQALDAPGRYIRRTMDAWVPAEATDLAFGFARRASAAEVAAGNGNGFVTPGQMVAAIDGLNDWDDIGGKPATFPASAHNHDDRYFTETEADGRFVQLAPAGGAAQSISGSLAANGLSVAADASTGLTIGRYSVGYAGSLLAIGGTFLSAQFGGVEKLRLTDTGNLGIGTAPNYRVHANGTIWAEGKVGITAPGGGGWIQGGATDDANQTNANIQIQSWWGIGFSPSISGQAVPQNENAAWIDCRNGDIGFRGALRPGGDAGTSSKVLTGNSSGVPAWKTLAELGFLQVFAEVASLATAYDAINQTVNIPHVKGCTALHRRNTASYYKSEVTFLAAQPDTSYLVFGVIQDDDGSYRAITPSDISAKTVNGFALNNTDTTPVGWSGFSIHVVR